jgi:hypothetical protein
MEQPARLLVNLRVCEYGNERQRKKMLTNKRNDCDLGPPSIYRGGA